MAQIDEVFEFHNNKYFDFVLRKLYQKNIKLTNKIFEKKYFHFDKDLLSNQKGYLDGYWQSFKYFENIRDILLKEFTLVQELNFENKLILNQINESNSVSIHIRRGDYVKDKKNEKIYAVFGMEYYEGAIFYLIKTIQNPSFFVFRMI
jgi:hypothetical protein